MTRVPIIRAAFEGLVVDNFAGGGGASTGIEAAIGRPVDIAINHDAAAIECPDAPDGHHDFRADETTPGVRLCEHYGDMQEADEETP